MFRIAIEEIPDGRDYYDEVHRVSVPKPLEGEKLGLTVQQQNGCVVVTRILSGGLVDQVGQLELGDIIIEVNNIEVHSAEDLMALVKSILKRENPKALNFVLKSGIDI